jgi:hypothetical protein
VGDVLTVHMLKTKQNLADVASNFTFSDVLLLSQAFEQFASRSAKIKDFVFSQFTVEE